MSSIMGFFIPYNNIHRMINEHFENTKSYNKCNFIIDLASCTESLYYRKSEYNKELGTEILEDILNLLVHYSKVFQYYNIDYRIILLYSDNHPKSCIDLYEEYNFSNYIEKTNNSYIRNSIKQSLDMLNKIVKFLYNTIYINTESDTVHFTRKIIKDSEDDRVNIILTKDITMAQNISNDDIILRPYKDLKTKNDLSYHISNKNKLNYIISSYKIKNDFKFNFDISNEDLITTIMAMSGLRQRYIPRTFKVKETVDILNEYYNVYKSIIPEELFNSFTDKYLGDLIYSYWKCVSSKYQYEYINDIINYTPKPLIDKNLLHTINIKTFDGRIDFDIISN